VMPISEIERLIREADTNRAAATHCMHRSRN
jgi:hypothetical protein